MHRHPCGTCISTKKASDDTESRLQPTLSLLLGLGVIATFAVALLALTTMMHPAWAGWPTDLASTECRPGWA